MTWQNWLRSDHPAIITAIGAVALATMVLLLVLLVVQRIKKDNPSWTETAMIRKWVLRIYALTVTITAAIVIYGMIEGASVNLTPRSTIESSSVQKQVEKNIRDASESRDQVQK